jgi:hypothetical protein
VIWTADVATAHQASAFVHLARAREAFRAEIEIWMAREIERAEAAMREARS